MRAAVKRSLIAGISIATIGAGAAAVVPGLMNPEPRLVKVAAAADGTGVAGQYIVTLKSGASLSAKASSYRATKRFDSALTAFTAKLDATQLRNLQRDPNVKAIEQDKIVRAFTTQKAPLPWGLDRIDQRSRPLSKSYTYKATGAGTNVYIIDSGIRTTHAQFEGRASVALDVVGDGRNGTDCSGHGTHVAGTIGSKTYGVAKKANLISVRVLDCDGGGYLSDIIEAINWLKANHGAKAVANISLGGAKSTALNNATTALSKSGVFVVAAAGNGDEDGNPLNACSFSPASAGSVEAVGATTGSDRRASWSNYGKCVDIHAPGNNITSTWYTGDTATKSISGTSMAAPHVAGVAALYKSKYGDATFGTIQKWLTDNSTKNKITGMKSSTANRLLYKAGL